MIVRLRGRSLDEVSLRGMQWARSRAERVKLALRGSQPWPVVELHPTPAHWLADRPTLTHLKSGGSAESLATHLRDALPGWRNAMWQLASDLRHGRCALLGLKNLEVGNPPRWHREARSGIVAPRTHWSRIDHLDAAVVGDHKVLWELNRHQYLMAPAMRWLADGDPEDFALVERHLGDWLDENPAGVGSNWASSLESAYRSITWCWLLWLLRSAPWRADLLGRLVAAMRWQGRHIEMFLSTYFSPNTHLTGEALGLFYIGSVIPELPESARWRVLGARILESSLERQVYADGVYFEQATQYQRYTAEIYLHYALLSASTGWDASAKVRESLASQFGLLRSLCDGRGYMPLIGDDDGGVLLPTDGLPPHDLSGLLLAAMTWLERPEFAVSGRGEIAQSVWLLGRDLVERQLRRAPTQMPWGDMHFTDGGLVTMRSGWSGNDASAIVDAGPHGAMNCGHAHADSLSMTVSLGSQPLFVDRGTYSYIAAERDDYRQTSSHNTLEFDGQSSVALRGPFQWGPLPDRPVARLVTLDQVAVLDAYATGHPGTDLPSWHRRLAIRLQGGTWVIADSGHRIGGRTSVLRWQLAPGLAAEQVAEMQVKVLGLDRLQLAWLAFAGRASLKVVTRDVAPRYGRREPAQVIELAGDARPQVLTVVMPSGATCVAPATRSKLGEGGGLVSWTDGAGAHDLWWSGHQASSFSRRGWSGTARLVCWGRPSAGPPDAEGCDWLLAVAASELRSPEGVTLVSSDDLGRESTVLFRRKIGCWEPVPASEPRRGRESEHVRHMRDRQR